MLPRVRIALLSMLLVLLAPPTAQAISCRTWNRLGPAQKSQQVESLIQQAVRGSGGRQLTSVGRASVERCLRGSARRIEYEIDDECASSRAGMNTLRVILKDYIWSCF